MSRNAAGERRVSIEQQRIFRTAQLAYVEIGRIAGMDPGSGRLMREWDIAMPGLLQFEDWTMEGLSALMLVRLPVVVGCVEGSGPLAWLANPEVLLAAQCHWPRDHRIPVIALAHQVTERTRIQAAGAGLFATSAAALSPQLPAPTAFRLWHELIKVELNPLRGTNKMAFVRVTGCDPRKLPAARLPQNSDEAAP